MDRARREEKDDGVGRVTFTSGSREAGAGGGVEGVEGGVEGEVEAVEADMVQMGNLENDMSV